MDTSPKDTRQQLIDSVAREFGKPVISIPSGGVLEGRIVRLEPGKSGKLRAILVCERFSAVLGVGEEARAFAGRDVTIENVAGCVRVALREQALDRGR